MKIKIRIPKDSVGKYRKLNEEERVKIKKHLSEQLGELLKGD